MNDSPTSKPRHSLARLLLVAAWTATLLYLGSLVMLDRPESGYSRLWEGWVSNVALALTATLLLLRAITDPSQRPAWWVLALASIANLVGDRIYVLRDQNLDPIPLPASSDAAYLTSYALLILGCIMLTQRNRTTVHPSIRLDGVIAGLGLAAAGTALFFDPVVDVSASTTEAILTFAYPLAGLTLLVLWVSGLAQHQFRPPPAMAWIGAGLVSIAVGDMVYLSVEAGGDYVQGTPLDGMWVVGFAALATAASLRRPNLPTAIERSSAGVLIVPAVAGALSVGVLGLELIQPVNAIAHATAALTLALVGVRTILTLREVRRLDGSHHQARTDDLTGLPNRRGFGELLNTAMSAGPAKDPPVRFALALMDLDGFKDINDTLGHHAGDALLREVGLRLRSSLPPEVLMARLGGDEFAAACPIPTDGGADQLGKRLVQLLDEPVELEGLSVRVRASCGVAVAPDDGSNQGELLRAADVAMYQAKANRTQVELYDGRSRAGTGRNRLTLLDELRAALIDGQLALRYQPIIDLTTEAPVAAEALVRWAHPQHGLLSPDQFLPAVGQLGLFPRLTSLVLDQAVSAAGTFQQKGTELRVSVNITAQDLVDPNFVRIVTATLDRHGLPGNLLTLEITEDTLVREHDRARHTVAALRERGVRFAVDDFGTGYQSLGQLLALDIDEIKLDRSLVAPLRSDRKARIITSAVVSLADDLGLDVVAEGIEDRETVAALRRLRCPLGQGFHVAVPMARAELQAWLTQAATVIDLDDSSAAAQTSDYTRATTTSVS